MGDKRRSDREKYDAAVWRQGAPRRAAEQERLLAMGTVVKERITLALDARGLYGPEVDIACGGAEPMVDEWEAGTRIPTPEQVLALSKLTEYPVKWFYEPVNYDEEKSPMFMCGERLFGRSHCEVVMTPAWGIDPPPLWFDSWARSAGSI